MVDKVCSPVMSTVTETVSSPASDFVEQEASSVMDSQEKESSKWTNEKHSLYLKSIEASFVDQLYNSLDMPSCQTQVTNCPNAISTWRNHPGNCIAYGQHKVLRCGYCANKRRESQKSHLKDAYRPHVSPENLWIQHFKNVSRKRLSSMPTATSLQYQHAIVAEVVDQNFVEDTSCSRKRARTAKISHANDDQVVPHFSSATTEIPDSHVSPKE